MHPDPASRPKKRKLRLAIAGSTCVDFSQIGNLVALAFFLEIVENSRLAGTGTDVFFALRLSYVQNNVHNHSVFKTIR